MKPIVTLPPAWKTLLYRLLGTGTRALVGFRFHVGSLAVTFTKRHSTSFFTVCTRALCNSRSDGLHGSSGKPNSSLLERPSLGSTGTSERSHMERCYGIWSGREGTPDVLNDGFGGALEFPHRPGLIGIRMAMEVYSKNVAIVPRQLLPASILRTVFTRSTPGRRCCGKNDCRRMKTWDSGLLGITNMLCSLGLRSQLGRPQIQIRCQPGFARRACLLVLSVCRLRLIHTLPQDRRRVVAPSNALAIFHTMCGTALC